MPRRTGMLHCQHHLHTVRPKHQRRCQKNKQAKTHAFVYAINEEHELDDLRGVRFGVALQEEADALLVRPVGIKARHDHDLPWQVPYETRRAEHRLAEPAEALHHEAESGLGTPARICGVQESVTDIEHPHRAD